MPSAYTTLYNFYFNNIGLRCSFFPRLDITGMNSNPKLKTTPGALLLSSVFGRSGNIFLPSCHPGLPVWRSQAWGVKPIFFYKRKWGKGDFPRDQNSLNSLGYVTCPWFRRWSWATLLEGCGSPSLLDFFGEMWRPLSITDAKYDPSPCPYRKPHRTPWAEGVSGSWTWSSLTQVWVFPTRLISKVIKAAPAARAFCIMAPEEILIRVLPKWWGFYEKLLPHQADLWRRKGDVAQQLTGAFQHELRPLQCPFKPVNNTLGFPSAHSLTIYRPQRQHLGEIPVLVLFPMGFWDGRRCLFPQPILYTAEYLKRVCKKEEEWLFSWTDGDWTSGNGLKPKEGRFRLDM